MHGRQKLATDLIARNFTSTITSNFLLNCLTHNTKSMQYDFISHSLLFAEIRINQMKQFFFGQIMTVGDILDDRIFMSVNF
jgi:hypothetical protein